MSWRGLSEQSFRVDMEPLPGLGCHAEWQRGEVSLIGCHAVKARMRSAAVVQHDDGTPTGSRSTSFFIRGILGPDAWSIFMRWLRRLAERFSVAASLVGHPGDGWRFRPGCSIGRLARPGVLAPLPMLTLRCSPPWQRCCRM